MATQKMCVSVLVRILIIVKLVVPVRLIGLLLSSIILDYLLFKSYVQTAIYYGVLIYLAWLVLVVRL